MTQAIDIEDKRVRATSGENTLVGTVIYAYEWNGVLDEVTLILDYNKGEITLSNMSGWEFEVIKPPRPKAHTLPLGTLVKTKTDGNRLIKVANDAWVLYGGEYRVDYVPTYRNDYVDENEYEEVTGE